MLEWLVTIAAAKVGKVILSKEDETKYWESLNLATSGILGKRL